VPALVQRYRSSTHVVLKRYLWLRPRHRYRWTTTSSAILPPAVPGPTTRSIPQRVVLMLWANTDATRSRAPPASHGRRARSRSTSSSPVFTSATNPAAPVAQMPHLERLADNERERFLDGSTACG
jgi:hypothetical protein